MCALWVMLEREALRHWTYTYVAYLPTCTAVAGLGCLCGQIDLQSVEERTYVQYVGVATESYWSKMYESCTSLGYRCKQILFIFPAHYTVCCCIHTHAILIIKV